MYNPCVTSSTLSIRHKSPFSYPFNDDCSYFPDYRNSNTHLISSSHSCCCLCCSPNYVYINLMNPTSLCGSRQSSLIHFSASRRVLIIPGPDPCRKCCCGSVKKRGFRQEIGRSLVERKFRRMVSEGRSCDFENAEMMLSLLGEERYVRERDCSALRRVKFKTKGSDSDRFLRDIKENVGSRSNYQATRIYSSENDAKSRRKEGKMSEHEEHLRGDKRRGRKSGSSCSSYYTCSSLGEDTESDNEIHHRNDACMEESGEVFKRDRKESGNVVYEGELTENLIKHGNVVGTHTIIESDWRKKSETKLNEVVIGEVCGTSDNRGSRSHKQFDTVENISKSFISESVIRQQNSRRSDQVIGGVEPTRKQKQFMETCEDDVEGISSSRNRFSGREEKSTVDGSFELGKKHEHVKTDNRVNRRDDYRFSTVQSNQVSQLEDINVKMSNITQSQEDKVKRQEDRYSVVPSSVQDTVKHYYLESEEDSRKMDSRRKFQQSSEISDDGISKKDDYRSIQVSQIQDMNARKSKISQAQYEDKVKRREQSAVISSSVQDTGNHYYSKSEEDLTQMDSREKFRQPAEISDDRVSRRDDYRLSTEQSDEVSQIQDTNVRRTNISRAQYEDIANRREGLSSVISSSVQDTENQYYLQSEDDLRQMDSRRKSQQSTETSAAQTQYVLSGQEVSKKVSTKGSLDISTVTLGQTSDTQNANIHKTSEDRISSGETYTSMFGKSTEERKRRTETSDNRVLRFESAEEAGDTSHKASSLQASLVLETLPSVGDGSTSQAHVMTPISQFLITSSQGGLDRDALHTNTEINAPSTETQIYDDPLTSISHEDALGSAHRFQKSSSKIVGEFLEKVTHEASTSHHQLEKSTSKDEMLIKGHKHEGKSSSEYTDVDFKLKDQGSRRSSVSSGVKGPSDEIWDEVAPSTREPVDSPTHVPETTSLSQSIVVKRTGRSLWNVFSDIVRLPWSSLLKTSTPKLGVRNSPYQSTKSEAWFSSHDQEETSDENMKRRNKNISRESIPTLTQYQGEGYSSSSSKDKISPSKTPIGSTTPKGSSSVSTEENFKMGGSTMMETSLSMPSLRIRRSPNVDEVTEVDNRTTISASGSLAGKEEQVTISSPINVKGSEANVGEDIKRRILQRTNQVIKDRFDEWEEAFTLESEQRKIDEAFMREALLEAKKAGDMWEVPVGAVLVQYGKIIARGYNLVEELRDSTAHAEMICIREGSNQLRTWRLADTTLYVTLEPCPMCAGAILQARVDTVVWGAPNKLLGADGSWIRLFPGGSEGGTSSESPDKPPAPVHPFHPKIVIRRGVLETECADVMRQFFQLRRRKKDNKQLPEIPPTPPSCLPISNHPTKILNRMQDAFHFMFCLQ